MAELYLLKRYEDLKEGEPVVALGRHILQWDWKLDGTPDYGIIPAENIEVTALLDKLQAAQERITKLELAFYTAENLYPDISELLEE